MSLWYLAKVPAFILVMVAQRYAFHPPTAAPPKEANRDKFGRSDLITKLTGWFSTLGDLINFSCHISECIGVIAHEYPSPLTAHLVSILYKDPSAVGRLVINQSFTVGFLLMVIGGVGRKICYDALGKFFTFQLAIFKDHKIITTGPYAVVRHPAYTAFLMAATGLLLLEFGPGSYVWESGMLQTPWKAVLWGIWAFMVFALQISTVKRVPREEAVMKQEFGREWEVYTKKTPYKLIPYFY